MARAAGTSPISTTDQACEAVLDVRSLPGAQQSWISARQRAEYLAIVDPHHCRRDGDGVHWHIRGRSPMHEEQLVHWICRGVARPGYGPPTTVEAARLLASHLVSLQAPAGNPWVTLQLAASRPWLDLVATTVGLQIDAETSGRRGLIECARRLRRLRRHVTNDVVVVRMIQGAVGALVERCARELVAGSVHRMPSPIREAILRRPQLRDALMNAAVSAAGNGASAVGRLDTLRDAIPGIMDLHPRASIADRAAVDSLVATLLAVRGRCGGAPA